MKPLLLSAVALALFAARPALAADAPSYTKDVQPFLTKYCVECHNDTKTKAGVNLDGFAALMKGSRRGPVVVAGKPEKSRLLLTMTGGAKQMPPRKSTQPKKAEIDMIKAWIAGGAKDDSDKEDKKDKPAPTAALSPPRAGRSVTPTPGPGRSRRAPDARRLS
jgi:hypothetical protein